MSKWFAINASAARISLHSDIEMGVTNAADFSKQIDTIKSNTIHIWINSNARDVPTGFAIYNMLARHKARKIVTIEGLAASMASVIAMAGDEIIMPENSMMMIHNPWGSVAGGPDQIASFGEALKTMQANIVAAYRKRTKLSEDKIQKMMDAETWLSAGEAKKLGFADKVEGALDMAASTRDMDLRRFARVPTFQNAKPRVVVDNTPRTLADLDTAAIYEKWNSAGRSQ